MNGNLTLVRLSLLFEDEEAFSMSRKLNRILLSVLVISAAVSARTESPTGVLYPAGYRSRRPAVGLVGPFRSNTRFHHGNRVASKPVFPKGYRGVLTRAQPCMIQGTTLETKLQCGLTEAP